jgi:hypothetical protein
MIDQLSPRPGTVVFASTILIVFGSVLALFGVLLLIGGAMLPSLRADPQFAAQLADVPDSFGTVLIVTGGVTALLGVGDIVTGGFALARRRWARIGAIGLGLVGALGALFALPGASSTGFGLIVVGLALLGYVFAAWALATNGAWFTGR